MEAEVISKMQKKTLLPLSDAIYEIILQEIISFRCHPGSRINESQVAESLDVSRSPVREAFNKLEKKTSSPKLQEEALLCRTFLKRNT